MKMLAYGLACAAVLTLAVPANAQIRIGDRDSGVSVRIGDGDRHHSRHHSRHHHRHYVRDSYAGCRVIKTRTHRPNGTVVIKTRRVCN
jgi:hypothetical protein